MNTAEKAKELGRILGQSDEYQALQRAHEQFKDKPDLSTKMDELQRVASAIETATSDGSEPAPEQVNAYNELLATIQADAAYQQVVVAQASFDKMMVQVNEQILEGMRTGASSRIITLS